MADKETEAEWARMRRVEAEREKARRALEGEGPNAEGLAQIGPQKGKVRGWSTDRNLLLRKTEKIGVWSIILVLAGVVMGVIADAGSIVGAVGTLGMATMIIAGIPGGISSLCFGLTTVFAVVVVPVELYYKVKDKRQFGTGWWSVITAVLVMAVYFLIKQAIMRIT